MLLANALRALATERSEEVSVSATLADLDAIEERIRPLWPEGEAPDDYLAWLRSSVLRQGAFLLVEDDVAAALARLEQAEQAAQDSEQVATVRAERGVMLAEQGRVDEGEPLVRSAVAELGMDHQMTLSYVAQFSQAVLDGGDPERADSFYEEFADPIDEDED